eukprot:scaffold315004_cov27-Tisochrysis_lutea.AAC.1
MLTQHHPATSSRSSMASKKDCNQDMWLKPEGLYGSEEPMKAYTLPAPLLVLMICFTHAWFSVKPSPMWHCTSFTMPCTVGVSLLAWLPWSAVVPA